jgi:BASS family bile acid:Na+ symporter
MEPAHLIKLAISASILLLVFALGLRASFGDAVSLFRTLFSPPHRLLRAVFAMNIVVPVVATAVATVFDLSLPVKVAVLAMAVAPLPPLLPGKQLKFGGTSNYVFGLLVAVSLAAVVMVPLGVDVLGRVFHRESHLGVAQVAQLVGTTILFPLFAALVVRRFAPGVAEQAAPWLSRLGTILLVAGLVPVLVQVAPVMLSMVGNRSVLAITLVVAAAIAAGHWLGGPDFDERTTLAIASAMRHPGIALAIATLNFPEEPRVAAAVLLYLLIAIGATSIYGAWRKRVQANQ